MKYAWDNKEQIDDIYVHDSILQGYTYDYFTGKIVIQLMSPAYTERIQFTFHNVLMHKLQSCCLWGPGVHVLVVYYDEENPLLKEAMELLKNEKKKHGCLYLDDNIHYVTVVFELNSGDCITIVCESFEYEEYGRRRDLD